MVYVTRRLHSLTGLCCKAMVRLNNMYAVLIQEHGP
jgi:hypothetical protein